MRDVFKKQLEEEWEKLLQLIERSDPNPNELLRQSERIDKLITEFAQKKLSLPSKEKR